MGGAVEKQENDGAVLGLMLLVWAYTGDYSDKRYITDIKGLMDLDLVPVSVYDDVNMRIVVPFFSTNPEFMECLQAKVWLGGLR